MILKEFINYTNNRLGALYPVAECKSIAVWLLVELGGYSNYAHLVEPESVIDSDKEAILVSAVERMCSGEPLQYVIGYEWFCGHKFNVAPGVLIPRPETEELVELIAGYFEGKCGVKVLDICTGSGCIAYSVAARLFEAECYGCDISSEALQIAAGQEVLEDGKKVEVGFFECDVLGDEALNIILDKTEGEFDVVVSNPPYICEQEKSLMRSNVLDFEPHLALFVPDSEPLLFYKKIATISKGLLKSGGMLFFEINERFGPQTLAMLEQLGYLNCKIVQDLNGKDRMSVAFLP